MADRLFSHELHQPESGEPCRVRISSVVGMAQTDGVTGIQLTDGRLLEVSETIDEVLTALGCGPDGHPLEAASTVKSEAAQSGVLGEVAAERERQVRKGFDVRAEAYEAGECAGGAIRLAMSTHPDLRGEDDEAVKDVLSKWPDPRQRLIVAAALLVAEVERMDRQAAEEDDR